MCYVEFPLATRFPLHAMIPNFSATPSGGRTPCSQPNAIPVCHQNPRTSCTLTESCGGICRQAVLLVVRARGCTQALYVGRCIFACETCQGESCKRSTQHPWLSSRDIPRSTKLVVLAQTEGLANPADTDRPGKHKNRAKMYETSPQKLSWIQITLSSDS